MSTVRSPRRPPPLRGGRPRPPRDDPGGGRFGGGRSLPRGLVVGCTVVGLESEPLPYSQSYPLSGGWSGIPRRYRTTVRGHAGVGSTAAEESRRVTASPQPLLETFVVRSTGPHFLPQ